MRQANAAMTNHQLTSRETRVGVRAVRGAAGS